MCESDSRKVDYLTTAFKDPLCFLDMVELGSGRGVEFHSGQPTDVPKVFLRKQYFSMKFQRNDLQFFKGRFSFAYSEFFL